MWASPGDRRGRPRSGFDRGHRDGLKSTVPVLIGTTRDESRYWLLYYDYLDRLPLSYAQPWLDSISGGDRKRSTMPSSSIGRTSTAAS